MGTDCYSPAALPTKTLESREVISSLCDLGHLSASSSLEQRLEAERWKPGYEQVRGSKGSWT